MGPRLTVGGARKLPAVASAAFAAALEYILVPAFLVSARGRILIVNRAGSRWLMEDQANRTALTGPSGPDRSLFAVSEHASAGTCQYLAVLAVPECLDPLPKLTLKAGLWSLTRRETEVVRWVLRGATNRVIADALACSVKTIEHHVSSILRKGDLENRASLIVAMRDA